MSRIFYLRLNPSIELDLIVQHVKTLKRLNRNQKSTITFRRLQNEFGRKWPSLSFLHSQPNMETYKTMARVQWKFANIRLGKEDEPKLAKFLEKYDKDPENVLQELLSAGYKLSISFIDDRSAFVVTISGSDRSKHNQSVSMSSWSDDFWEAVVMSGYKHFVVAQEGDWSDHDTETANWG